MKLDWKLFAALSAISRRKKIWCKNALFQITRKVVCGSQRVESCVSSVTKAVRRTAHYDFYKRYIGTGRNHTPID